MAGVLESLELSLSFQLRGRTEGPMTKAFHSMMDKLSRERKDTNSSSGQSNDSPLEPNSETGTQLYHQFSLADIRVATKNFNKSKGSVTAKIAGKKVEVAIKRFKKPEAVGEVIHPKNLPAHPNILSPIGFCTQGDELIIVHDYMAHGSLQDHLYGEFARLPWEQRLEICIGAAQGLEYLHAKGEREVIHRLIEPSCILLDENLVAKVLLTNIRTTTNRLETPYDSLSQVDDLYSFGVTLLEVLTCDKLLHYYRHPRYRDAFRMRSLRATLRSNIQIYPVMDSDLSLLKIEPESLRYFAETTLICLSEGLGKIDSVVEGLQFALEKQKRPQGLTTTAEPPIQGSSGDPGQWGWTKDPLGQASSSELDRWGWTEGPMGLVHPADQPSQSALEKKRRQLGLITSAEPPIQATSSELDQWGWTEAPFDTMFCFDGIRDEGGL